MFRIRMGARKYDMDRLFSKMDTTTTTLVLIIILRSSCLSLPSSLWTPLNLLLNLSDLFFPKGAHDASCSSSVGGFVRIGHSWYFDFSPDNNWVPEMTASSHFHKSYGFLSFTFLVLWQDLKNNPETIWNAPTQNHLLNREEIFEHLLFYELLDSHRLFGQCVNV